MRSYACASFLKSASSSSSMLARSFLANRYVKVQCLQARSGCPAAPHLRGRYAVAKIRKSVAFTTGRRWVFSRFKSTNPYRDIVLSVLDRLLG